MDIVKDKAHRIVKIDGHESNGSCMFAAKRL